MSSPTIGRNLLANLLGQGWTALVALLAVPVFLHFLGADGFGLIGFYMTLSALLAVLDGGMGAAATRATATLSSTNEEERTFVRETLRSIEVLFGIVAVATGVAFALLAPLIARDWLQVPAARVPETTHALSFMAGALAIQFVQGFYSGCLVGLQRQVLLNGINALFSTLRSGGAVLVLWLASPTVSAFFAWQVVVGLVSLVFMHVASWRVIGGGVRPRLVALLRSGRFALGVGATNVLSLVLTQLDKILLSRLLPLQAYGYYMVAWTAGTLALRAAGPVFNAYYPALTALARKAHAKPRIERMYMQGASVLSVAVAPLTAVLVLFPEPLLLAWTGDTGLATSAALPLAMIALGSMGNAYMHLPYALQLAHGRTRIALLQNLVAVALVPPITWFGATRYGLAGASLSWLLLNAGYIMFTAPIAQRGLVDYAIRTWYWRCIAAPLVLSMAIGGVLVAASMFMHDRFAHIGMAGLTLCLSIAACAKFARADVRRLLTAHASEPDA